MTAAKHPRHRNYSEPRQPEAKRGKYSVGDYLRINIPSATTGTATSVWIRVERCDDEHGLVFGSIEAYSPVLPSKALSIGSKLGASYRHVQE